MDKRLVILIIIILGLWSYYLDSIWAKSYVDLQDKVELLQADVIHKSQQAHTIDTRKNTLSQEIHRLNQELESTHKSYLAGIERIDQVNSNFTSYGDSRFREGYVKSIYTRCLRQIGLVDFCGGIAADAYAGRIWENNVPGWNDVWKIIRGLIGESL